MRLAFKVTIEGAYDVQPDGYEGMTPEEIAAYDADLFEKGHMLLDELFEMDDHARVTVDFRPVLS
jgi:hypothetical protein